MFKKSSPTLSLSANINFFLPQQVLILCINILQQMSGRTYVLILFFWAILTIVTPILVRLSANAKQSLHHNGEIMEGLKTSGAIGLLSRRALISMAPTQAAAPARVPVPEGEAVFSLKRLLPVTEDEVGFGMKRLLKVKR